MQTSFGHLTYCTNIHSGETWTEHFAELNKNIPAIKKRISPDRSFGIGLRLSNIASLELIKDDNLEKFKSWLLKEDCYVFTINGFPYGSFHGAVVKEKVHFPDWLTNERVYYTNRLIMILGELLPIGMEGSISTSPLSYKHWHKTDDEKKLAYEVTSINFLRAVEQCSEIRALTGKVIHIDIEPEPDGLLETVGELVLWYNQHLLFKASNYFKLKMGFQLAKIESLVKRHIRVCYDICHFAVEYENHHASILKLQDENIGIGKIQISAAIKADMEGDRSQLKSIFERFNEPTYLHQVVGLLKDKSLKRFKDLPEAISDINNQNFKEWRAHFHVPLFVENFENLQSTQNEIVEILGIHSENHITDHFEVETYTWEVLPPELKLSLDESIVRELNWVKEKLEAF